MNPGLIAASSFAQVMLSGILNYHVVAGQMDAAVLTKAIADGGGKASLKTVAGGNLTAMAAMGGVTITDEKAAQPSHDCRCVPVQRRDSRG